MAVDQNNRAAVAVYGESLIDLLCSGEMAYRAALGGSPYNVARALGRQRVPVSYLAPLSRDKMGEALRAGLAEANVEAPAPPSARPSSLSVVDIDGKGQARYSLYRDGVADRDIDLGTITSILPPGLAVFHCGSLALIPEEIGQTLAVAGHLRQLASPPLICVDLNLRPQAVNDADAYAGAIARIIPVADLVKLSDGDLAALPYGKDPERASAEIAARMGRGAVIITLGSRGSLVRFGQQRLATAAVELDVVDTIGAGDCFQAGVIAWLHRHGIDSAGRLAQMAPGQWRDCLDWASLCAAFSIGKAGCCPPTMAQIEDLAARIRPVSASEPGPDREQGS